jgi:hypothetical protein
MQLAHTCCTCDGDELVAMDDEEASEIRDEERKLLEQMEVLVAEFEENTPS